MKNLSEVASKEDITLDKLLEKVQGEQIALNKLRKSVETLSEICIQPPPSGHSEAPDVKKEFPILKELHILLYENCNIIGNISSKVDLILSTIRSQPKMDATGHPN